MPSILLTFEDDTQYDQFIKAARALAEQLSGLEDCQPQSDLFLKILGTAVASPAPPDTKEVKEIKTCNCCCSNTPEKYALFITGKKMMEASLPELQKIFKREIVQHSGSVQIRGFRNGEWVTIMNRPRH
jgi:hypothetical protein